MITFERVSVSMTVRDCTWRQDGTNFARLRVSANGVTRFKTQIIVQRCEVAPDGRIKVPELRHRLEDYLRKVEIKVAKLSDEVVKDMTIDDVVAYIQRDDRFKLDFIEYYQQAIKDKKLHSQKAYSSALNAFISWGKIAFRYQRLSLHYFTNGSSGSRRSMERGPGQSAPTPLVLLASMLKPERNSTTMKPARFPSGTLFSTITLPASMPPNVAIGI